jgi:pimeloyl-ACP methyl ester carboxylesterase
MENRPEARELVVLVHGLWTGRWALAIVAARLQHCGYEARRFHYPSVGVSLSANAEALARFAESLDVPRVHFIGHSLGGLVILRMLQTNPELPFGRIVLLGSPYAGSRAAEVLARTAAGRLILGHSLMEWLRVPPSKPGQCEIGVLAGNRGIGLGHLVTRLPEPNDGVVTEDEARVPGMRDFICLPVSHSEMLWSRKVAQQICDFLGNGCFDHSA